MCFKIWHHPFWDLQGLVPVCCLLGFAALLKIKQVFIWFLQTFSSQRRYRKMVGMEERLSCSDASSVSSILLPFFFFCLHILDNTQNLRRFLWEPSETRGKGYNCCLTPNTVVLSFLSTAGSLKLKVRIRATPDRRNSCVQTAVSVVTLCFVSGLLANFLVY